MRFGAFFGKFSLVMPGLDPGIHQIFKAGWIAGSSPAMTLCRRSRRPGRSAGLTMLQPAGAFCVDPEQLPAIFMISKPQCG